MLPAGSPIHIIPQRSAFFMQNTNKVLSFLRTVTTLKSNYVSTASPISSLLLDSYSQAYERDNIYYKNRKIDRLLKSGYLNLAINMFDEMPNRDVVTYNLLISGYGRYGLKEQAIRLYSEMVLNGIKESGSTFSSVLAICSKGWLCKEGIQAHCRVTILGFSSNLFVCSSLIDLYMQMGFKDIALKLFEEIPDRNLAVWNLTLRGFCELGLFDEMLRLYSNMEFEDVKANALTFSYLIRGCANERFIHEGEQLHCRALKVGLVESDIFVANALVDVYSACGRLIDARKTFNSIKLKDVISWNSIVAVHVDNGYFLEGLELFSRMQFWGKRPSIRSLMAFLSLSGQTENIHLGKQIHCYALKLGFDNGSVHIQSGLISLYGKCKEIESSVAVYESIAIRTLECCNSLMTSLLNCGFIKDVFEMFGLMVDEGIGIDEVTLSTTLKALSLTSPTSLASCKLLHSCSIKSGFGSNFMVSCSFMDVYSKSGHIKLSQQVFNELTSPNVICFTSIINGYARNGMGRECLEILKAMITIGMKPDKVTFLCALMGCNHSGLVEEGRFVFDLMKTFYGFSPDLQHYSCMADLLGRAGLLDEAEKLLQKALATEGNSVILSSMLRSCRVHGNAVVGRRVAKKLMDLESADPEVCLHVSNFFSEIGDFGSSEQLREFAMAKKFPREIGHSLIEI